MDTLRVALSRTAAEEGFHETRLQPALKQSNFPQ